MKKDEVILRARHGIDLGKSFVDPSNFVLTEVAKRTLATNYE